MTRSRLIAASWAGTAALGATTVAAIASPMWRPVAAGVGTVLFVAGIVLFFWAYAIAVARSRTDSIGIGGLFFLAGAVAPASVRRALLGAMAAQAVIGITGAALRPFTSLAFGVLAPVFGLGASGLWAARYGRFDRRGRPLG